VSEDLAMRKEVEFQAVSEGRRAMKPFGNAQAAPRSISPDSHVMFSLESIGGTREHHH
jgi:hypothetical protein